MGGAPPWRFWLQVKLMKWVESMALGRACVGGAHGCGPMTGRKACGCRATPSGTYLSRSSSSSSRIVARLSSPKLSLDGPELCTGLSSGVRAVGSGPRAGGWNLRLYRLVMSICKARGVQSKGAKVSDPHLPHLFPAPSGADWGWPQCVLGGVQASSSPFSCSSTSVCPDDSSTQASCSSLPCKCLSTSWETGCRGVIGWAALDLLPYVRVQPCSSPICGGRSSPAP